MSCDCTVKDIYFINELTTSLNDYKLNYDLKNLIPAFDPKYSGIFQPVFFDKTPQENQTKSWIKADVQNEDCDSSTPEGLGIRDFIKIENPKLRNWTATGNLQLTLDWEIDFSKIGYSCKEYTQCVLFWYRYYDMGRESSKDLRIFPGIDLYISNGDMAVVDEEPVITQNLVTTFNQIRSSLINAGYDNQTAKYNASVLSTGPQIDRITEILSGPSIDNERTDLKLVYLKLSGISDKRYSDIGQDNYISTKTDLLKKLSSKYGINLVVPEGSETILASKFKSTTGPNIQLDINSDLLLSDKEETSGYDISIYLNDTIKLEAYRSDENFTVTIPAENDEDESAETIYNINYVKFNDKIIGYNLSEKNSGIFDPNFTQVKFHGLGGIDFETSLDKSSSCNANINSETFDGPYFSQDYKSTSLDGVPSNIFIKIKTHNNSQFKFGEGISISYLRSESKPDCPSFIENNDSCSCFSLMDLHPDASGQKTLTNEEDLFYIPSTSMFYLPSGKYYAGLTSEEVENYEITMPDHPSPGTSLPKTHSPFFNIGENCSYKIDGCGNKRINLNFDYPADLRLVYQSTNAHFKLEWEEELKENEDPYFTASAGTLCLIKKTQTPSEVYIDVEVPENEPNTEWAVELSGIQIDYIYESTPVGFSLVAQKGFFHPNFGWTYDPKYYNKTPIIPDHKNIFSIDNQSNANTISVSFNADSTRPTNCSAIPHGTKRITIPGSIQLPAKVIITGGVDDELLVNGARVEAQIGRCTLAHSLNYSFISNQRTFTVAAGDNIFGKSGYNLNISFESMASNNNLKNYFYNAYAMYKEQYLPGYNFMYDISELSDEQKNKINNSSFIGIKTNGSCYFVTNNWEKIRYNEIESMMLDNVPFEFVNIDYTYGYAYNDFTFVRQRGSSEITVTSQSNQDRIINYFDNSPTSVTLTSAQNFDKKFKVNVIGISEDNKLTLSRAPDDDWFLSGYLQKTLNDGQFNQSVLIYKPNVTYDDQINIGKWGNMSYGNAVIRAAKHFDIDVYDDDKFLKQNWFGSPIKSPWHNNSLLRTSTTINTSMSWGCPISFVNNYDKDNQTHYYPTTKLFDSVNNNGTRRSQTLNYEKQLNINEDPSLIGDKIISKGNIKDVQAYVYLGSITGKLKISVKVNKKNANVGFVVLKHDNEEIERKDIEEVDDEDEIVLYYDKKSTLPIYGELYILKNSTLCISDQDVEQTEEKVYLEEYRVELDLSQDSIKNDLSRIAYYAHEPPTPLWGQKKTNAVSDTTDVLSLNKEITRLSNREFNPFLDLHIFETDDTKKTIVSNSGIVYFEDFFQPKSNDFIKTQMEVPYNNNLYWIDLPVTASWNLLTSKGILLNKNINYKILKKISYECKDQADICSGRYPEDICEESYDLTKGDIYDILGLTGAEDQKLIEISEVSFPDQCDNINFCCKSEEECKTPDCDSYEDETEREDCYKAQESCLSEREACLESEKQFVDDCKDFWLKDSKIKISCKDICPTGSISGSIDLKTLEYYIVKVKDDAAPPISISELPLTFLPQSGMIDIPCTDINFSNIGSAFLYNYACSEIQKDCQTIINNSYDSGSEYVPGTLLDLSSLKLNEEKYTANKNPDFVILENEKRYRDIVPHTNKISYPFYEYDPESTSKYIITHNFSIKSKECVEPGDLFTLSIDDLTCDFSLNSTSSGLVLESSCFDDVVVDPKSDSYLTVYKTICEGKFNCSNNDRNIPCSNTDNCEPKCDCQPLGCEKEWSCDDAAEYLKTINSNYELIKCEEITLPEDYYLACRQCSDAYSPCQTSIYYSDPLPKECYCPPDSTLIDHPDYGKICETEYTTIQLKSIEYKDYFYYDVCETEEKTVKYYVGATCFPEVKGPSKEALENYEKGCDGTEFVSKSSYDQTISIDNNAANRVNFAGQLASAKEDYRIQCESKKLGETLAKCIDPCYDSYSNCIQSGGGPQCHKALSACTCPCYASFYNAGSDLEGSRAIYYTCFGNCNISDSIQTYFSGAYGWWWYCGEDSCYVPNTAANTPCNPERCCPDTSCEYNSCQDLEKRVKFNYYHGRYTCQLQEDGYTAYADFDGSSGCEPRNMTFLETYNTSYSIKTREVTTYSKTKKKILSQKESMDNTSTVKVFNKEYKLTFKNNEDCDPACEDNEICCDGECISEEEVCCEDKTDINISLVFEIYDNLIVGIINNDQYNKIYHERSSVPFKCPKINFEAKNDKLYMCNTVSSECLNCFAGAKNV